MILIFRFSYLIDSKILKSVCNTICENAFKYGIIKKEVIKMMSNINITVDEEIDDFTYFNTETIEAIEETERNLKNSNRKRYSSIQELREALENNIFFRFFMSFYRPVHIRVNNNNTLLIIS